MIPIVQVKQGKLQGTVQNSVLTGNQYYSFRGIPFAKPPINDLRFQAPVPLEKWDGILDATQDGIPCIQNDIITGVLYGSEDCLFINVYTPSLPVGVGKTNLKPVMVFIHGGGFYAGNGSSLEYAPDFLINYEVVFVTISYRLHALGFLNMGTRYDASNCGLRDQILALKWVKENIEQFGGDSGNITIFGESAGASSVHYHLVSPLSKGLFHKAILQSGTYNCIWSLKSEPEQTGFELARKLGYIGNDDPVKAVEYLKKQPAQKIVQAIKKMHDEWRLKCPGKPVTISFLPSIEKEKRNAVIPDHPEILMKTADPVPLIVGFNTKEGRLAFATVSVDNLIETLKEDFTVFLKYDIKAEKERLSLICSKIKEFYFGEKEIGKDAIDTIVDLYTDLMFKNFYESFDNITNSKHPVYVYEFGFNGSFNVYSKFMMRNHAISYGAAHADEMPYIFFKPAIQKTEFVEPELTVIKNMCTMWTNFARTGNPTEGMKTQWRRHTAEQPCYLRIDSDINLMEGKITPQRIEFWKNLRARESI